MNATGLRRHINQPVTLYFRDGEVVEAILLGIDPDRDRDLTYEVTRIVHEGTPRARGTELGGTCVARIVELLKWELGDSP